MGATHCDKVDVLKKITLEFQCGMTEDRMNLISVPAEFEFIFGIGPDGLSPFEYDIAGKSVNDEVLICLQHNDIGEKFGSLASFFRKKLPEENLIYIKIHITGIDIAENREVIKALAENVAHDPECECGCGCGCGCGG